MILAIESTMDETGAAVVEKWGKGVKVLAEAKASSAEIHEKYGGVVPEIAAREQVKVVLPVVKDVLGKIGGGEWQKGLEKLETVAVAYGPGMMGSLLVGVETARVISEVKKIKLVKVNHMIGHVAANWIKESESEEVPELPAVGLIVSGGHTDLVSIDKNNKWKWLGGTRDDAAGEAFDKSARLMGLSDYLGGVAIEKAAGKITKEDDNWWKKAGIRLPRPMLTDRNLEMSFSGLKTAVLHEVGKLKRGNNWDESKARLLAREFNEAVVEVLVKKTERVIKEKQPRCLLLGGGVAANSLLRKELEKLSEKYGLKLFKPEMKYCTDNAAMIGAGAVVKGKEVESKDLKARPDLGVVE